MSGVQIIEFGKGDKVIAYGQYGGEYCVFISDAKIPGLVGQSADREGICDDYIGENPIVIITKSEKRAKIIHAALTSQLDHLDI